MIDGFSTIVVYLGISNDLNNKFMINQRVSLVEQYVERILSGRIYLSKN
jgi:hypothetical protein